MSSTAAEATTLFAANLGYCCALCSSNSSCTMVTYVKVTRWCQLLPASTAANLTRTADPTSVLLVKVDQIGNSVPLTASMQPVTGTLVQPGQAEGFTSYNLSKAINAAHCWRLCLALTGGRCRLFAHHASLLSCLVYDVDFYDSWTTLSTSDTNWTSYYAKRTNGWKLLFKISKGMAVDASDMLFSGPTSESVNATQMALNANCSCFLRNGIIDQWSHFPITTVSLVLATGGVAMKFVNFSTTSADTVSTFFTVSKITASSWTDLTSSTVLSRILIGTSTVNYYGRYFLVMKDDNNCEQDSGWISVNGQGSAGCSYDHKPVPQFAYSQGTTYATFSAAAFADALLLYVQI